MQRRRLLYLDVFRGFIILIMILVHPLAGLVYQSDPGSLDTIRISVLVLCAPFAIVATWAPVFALTSGAANAYVMLYSLKNQDNAPGVRRRMLYRGLLNGAMVYLFSMFSLTFLHLPLEFNGKLQQTLLTGYLMRGALPAFCPEFLFFNDALAMLAITSVFTTILLCVLWRGDGAANPRRTCCALGSVAALLLVASPFLHGWLDDAFFRALTEKRWAAAFALKCFIGPRFSPIPLVAYSLFGAIFGVGLAQGETLAWFRRFGYGTGVAFLGMFAVLCAAAGFHFAELLLHTVPMKVHLLDLGLILITATILLEISEFRSAACRERFARATKVLQRLGRVSLSIFLTETVIAVLLVKPYLFLWAADTFPRKPQAILPFLAMVVLFWVAVSKVWERYGYRYGVEWFLVWLNAKVLGHQSLRLASRTAENSAK